MATQAQVASDMIAALNLADPDVDTNIGSIARKLIDATAESIAEASGDVHLLSYLYDIDAKSGADLDEMVRPFGFARLPTKRAYGELVFSRSKTSSAAVYVPAGTQAATSVGTTFSTITTSVIISGATSISIPAIANLGGTAGNVAAASITVRKTPTDGVSFVTNPVSFSGGTNLEDDASLRKRFKATVFRNMSGTESMFLGIALDNANVSQANVIGATKRWRERIQVTGFDTYSTSTVPDAKLIYPFTAVVGANISAGDILSSWSTYYFDAASIPPRLKSEDITAMPTGVYDLEYDYLPTSSRNDPTNGITNRVDLYIRGSAAQSATENVQYLTAWAFTSTPSDSMYNLKWQRQDESSPAVGNHAVFFTYVPIAQASFNATITIAGVTYTKDVDFWVITNKTFGLSSDSLQGIEIRSQANGGPANPANATRFNVVYDFNSSVREVALAIRNWRLVGTDIKVHEGKLMRLRVNLAAILSYGTTQAQAQADLYTAIAAFINKVGFNSVVQASDILAVAHQVSGVDAVRFLTDNDNGFFYAIQRMDVYGAVHQVFSTGTPPKRTLDVFVPEDSSPILDSVHLEVLAQNTWGSA